MKLFFTLIVCLFLFEIQGQTLLNHDGNIANNTTWTHNTCTQGSVSGNSYVQLLSSSSSMTSPSISLVGTTNPVFNFKARTFGGISGSSNVITIEISTDGGSTFPNSLTRTPTSSTLTSMTSIDLNPYNSSSTVVIRLSTLSATGSIGVGVDDLIASYTLPISLSKFNANSNQKQVDLNWTKTNAQNFDKFVLEHSIDGNTFRSIDEINGNTGENYTFTHISPAIGTNYYRLKIMDLDGSYSYSPIVSAFVKSDKKWAVLPNQSVDNQIRVLSSDVNTTINIVDMNGKLILSLDSNGNPETLIQVGHLPKGLYTVQFFEGTNLVNNQRFVKQ